VGLGFDGPVAKDPDALAFRTAVGVLGGGTSSRLFLDVRERRGLAYAVGSRYDEGLALGAVTISVGTTPERVAETLERIQVVLAEYGEHGPTDEEVSRIVVMLRASLLMQQEEGPSRARQLALDSFRLDHPRSMAEILEAYAGIDPDDVRRVATERLGEAWRTSGTRCLLGPASAIGV
jgi:predicted Zn-dependent peptidase